MLFGFTQTIGYLSLLPVAHRLKRRMVIVVTNALIVVCAAALYFLSTMEHQTQELRLIQSLISTFGISVFNAMGYIFFFAIISESYPTRIRGAANALILYVSKLIGSNFPIFKNFSLNHGFHVMVGCSVLTLLVIPLMFLVEETLHKPSTKKEKSDESDDKGSQVSRDRLLTNKTVSGASKTEQSKI